VRVIVTGVFGRGIDQKLLLLAVSVRLSRCSLVAEEGKPAEVIAVTSVAGGMKAYCNRVRWGGNSPAPSSVPTGRAG